MAIGIALVFENTSIDTPFDDLVEVIRKSASDSWHCSHTINASIQDLSFADSVLTEIPASIAAAHPRSVKNYTL